MMAQISRSRWLAVLVFGAALLPRLYALGGFLTIDEVKWAEGAVQFLTGLYQADLFRTYWHFHPGVTVAWGGALILGGRCLTAPAMIACAHAQVENLGETIGWLRLAPALITSLGVTGVYLLVRKLIDNRLALLTAFLLAFDPFFIAHSRILNGDAGAAILMFLSLLAFLIYWPGQMLGYQGEVETKERRKLAIYATKNAASSQLRNSYLILSGVLAGLALLTKLPAPVIGLFIGGLGAAAVVLEWPAKGAAALRHQATAILIWGGLALTTFVLLWPAMWVAPLDTLQLMYVDAFEVGEAGAGHDTFFLGQILPDPGPWFYPYVIAFRLTPVVTLGLLIFLAWLLWTAGLHLFAGGKSASRAGDSSQAENDKPSPTVKESSRKVNNGLDLIRTTTHYALRTTLRSTAYCVVTRSQWIIGLTMIAFVIFIIIMANFSPKKLDRYVMPVIPALIFLAAWGLIAAQQFAGRFFAAGSKTGRSGLLVGAVGLQFLFAILATPYYLNYYNPLLGGLKRAVAQVPVGWGEGLEQAAFYLNNLPQAETLTVSSWYSDLFNLYFVGERASFADDGRAQLAADYVVFYVNQIQREKPYPGLVDYFRANESALVMSVGPDGRVFDDQAAGAPTNRWVEVYKAPAAQSAGGAPKIEGVAQLLAYKIVGFRVETQVGDAETASDLAANELAATLFLRVLGPRPEETTLTVALTPVDAGHAPPIDAWQLTEVRGEWRKGGIVEWRGVLSLPEPVQTGPYRLKVVFQFKDGSPIAEMSIADKDPPVQIR